MVNVLSISQGILLATLVVQYCSCLEQPTLNCFFLSSKINLFCYSYLVMWNMIFLLWFFLSIFIIIITLIIPISPWHSASSITMPLALFELLFPSAWLIVALSDYNRYFFTIIDLCSRSHKSPMSILVDDIVVAPLLTHAIPHLWCCSSAIDAPWTMLH